MDYIDLAATRAGEAYVEAQQLLLAEGDPTSGVRAGASANDRSDVRGIGRRRSVWHRLHPLVLSGGSTACRTGVHRHWKEVWALAVIRSSTQIARFRSDPGQATDDRRLGSSRSACRTTRASSRARSHGGDPDVVVGHDNAGAATGGAQPRALIHRRHVQRHPEIGGDEPLGSRATRLAPACVDVAVAEFGEAHDADREHGAVEASPRILGPVRLEAASNHGGLHDAYERRVAQDRLRAVARGVSRRHS
jgi:hypothetical protein